MNYLERIENREKEITGLRARQDADKDLLYLKEYAMADADKKAVPGIVSVTLNRPAVFAANVISALGRANEQIVVESERKSFDAAFVEDFLRACFVSADARLKQRGKWKLSSFLDEQVCIRGGAATRCAFQMSNGVLVPDIAQWDYRYVTWEMGVEGLAYAAYSLLRRPDEIKAQLWYQGLPAKSEVDRLLEKTTASIMVRDVWDSTHNEIWIEKELVFEQPHSYGLVPVVLGFVPLGSMLADTDALSHYGESIFFLIRTIIPELNRLASIMQTLNLRAVKAPMKAKKKGGGGAPEWEDIAGIGAVAVIEPDEDIQPIDYGDAKRSAEIISNKLDKAMDEGSLTSYDLGTFTQPMSAIALIEIGEGRDQVWAPRLETKASIKEQLCRMVLSQCQQIGGTLEIGTEGHKRSFDTEKLKGEYDISVKYFPKSPKVDMARYAMAAQGKTVGLTQKAIDEEILQREDPEGDERQRRWEQAEQLSPAIRLHRVVKSLIDDAERGDEDAEFEAELISAEMGVSLQAMLTGGDGQKPQVEEPLKPNPLMAGPLGNVPTSSKRAKNVEMTPLPAEGEE